MQKLKISFTALLTMTALVLGAQGLGLRGGVNFQNINGKDALGDQLENDLITGYHAGLNVEIPIAPDFYFQPGIMYSTKGAKDKSQFLGQDIDTKVVLGYLEVPLNLVYKPLLGTGNLILGLGPYLGYAITGNSSGDAGDFGIEFKSSVDESDSENVFYFKRFDSGANLMAGYEFAGGLSFQLNAQLGLVDINSDFPGDSSIKWNNTGFGLSLGYRFK